MAGLGAPSAQRIASHRRTGRGLPRLRAGGLYCRPMRGPFASPSRRLPLPPLLVCVLLATAAAIFVSQCLWLDKVLIDDSFITFSFSKNLAAGNGPLYSHGVRAEGY